MCFFLVKITEIQQHITTGIAFLQAPSISQKLKLLFAGLSSFLHKRSGQNNKQHPLNSQAHILGDQTHIVRVLVEADLHKILEGLGEVARQLGWVVLWNEEQHAHGMKVGVGRLAFRKLYCCDAQTPDVRLDNMDQL